MALANSAPGRRRLVIAGAAALTLLLVWCIRLGPADYSEYSSTLQSAKDLVSSHVPASEPAPAPAGKPEHSSTSVLPHVESYFDQAFSHKHPELFPYSHLKEACDRAPWNDEEVYLKCNGMAAGMFSIVSQVKVCLKMAVETGRHLVLPAMPLRDSEDLTNFNFLNGTAYLTYDSWFDADHLREQMGRACPKMKIIHPDELDKSVKVKDLWSISCGDAPGYQKIHSYFWVGRPYKTYFDSQLKALRVKAAADPKYDKTKTGITVIDVDSEFLLFRITDDPTQRELRWWNDLSHLVRFKEEPRQIIRRLLDEMGPRSYYGVHFRVEKDNVWSDLDSQLKRDLDALDEAWEIDNRPEPRPLVYLACGDQEQVEKFVVAGKERGWEVTHKWRLSKHDAKTQQMINDLPFDFQGAVDMGVMVRSSFFLGITGSAFSSSLANQRDVTGRYRGSSFAVMDDEGARTHLFNDKDADEYACCL